MVNDRLSTDSYYDLRQHEVVNQEFLALKVVIPKYIEFFLCFGAALKLAL